MRRRVGGRKLLRQCAAPRIAGREGQGPRLTAGDFGSRVLSQTGVQHSVGHLIGQFVRVSLVHRFRSEQESVQAFSLRSSTHLRSLTRDHTHTDTHTHRKPTRTSTASHAQAGPCTNARPQPTARTHSNTAWPRTKAADRPVASQTQSAQTEDRRTTHTHRSETPDTVTHGHGHGSRSLVQFRTSKFGLSKFGHSKAETCTRTSKISLFPPT